MTDKQFKSRLHNRAEAAWPCVRVVVQLFAVALAFCGDASAAVITPENSCRAGSALVPGHLVGLRDLLTEVRDYLEQTVAAGMGNETAVEGHGNIIIALHGSGSAHDAPSDTPPEGPAGPKHLDYRLSPNQSSSSTTAPGSGSAGGGISSMFAMVCGAASHLSANSMITRLVLTEQLFPPSPPACGIFHPPRVSQSHYCVCVVLD